MSTVKQILQMAEAGVSVDELSEKFEQLYGKPLRIVGYNNAFAESVVLKSGDDWEDIPISPVELRYWMGHYDRIALEVVELVADTEDMAKILKIMEGVKA